MARGGRVLQFGGEGHWQGWGQWVGSEGQQQGRRGLWLGSGGQHKGQGQGTGISLPPTIIFPCPPPPRDRCPASWAWKYSNPTATSASSPPAPLQALPMPAQPHAPAPSTAPALLPPRQASTRHTSVLGWEGNESIEVTIPPGTSHPPRDSPSVGATPPLPTGQRAQPGAHTYPRGQAHSTDTAVPDPQPVTAGSSPTAACAATSRF